MELSKEMETEIKEAEAKMTKEERDQLSNDIHNMTDEELMDAVMNDNKVIEQEDNNEVGNAPSSPVNQFIKSMSKEDILQLYSISKKIKANPSYNVVQYHTINGENYRYEELIDLIAETTRGTTYERMTVDDAINKVFVVDTNGNVVVNPFIDDILIKDGFVKEMNLEATKMDIDIVYEDAYLMVQL